MPNRKLFLLRVLLIAPFVLVAIVLRIFWSIALFRFKYTFPGFPAMIRLWIRSLWQWAQGEIGFSELFVNIRNAVDELGG
jgi:hypothetical protein